MVSTRLTRSSSGQKLHIVASGSKYGSHDSFNPPDTPLTVNGKRVSGRKSFANKETPNGNAKPIAAVLPTPAKTASQPRSSVKQAAVKRADKELRLSMAKAAKRKRPMDPKVEEDPDELPHNMGKRPLSKKRRTNNEITGEPVTSPTHITSQSARKVEKVQEAKDVFKSLETTNVTGTSLKKKAKGGLTHGETPFPDWLSPTPEECTEVHDLLLSTIPPERHHKFFPPDTIPEPSEIVAGCGEVPSILDALIRTLLSANTTGSNSSTAFQGLIARFGLEKSGAGKGSVDWNAVRLAPLQDIHDAIEHGGMAPKKSKWIKEILDTVYKENQERRKAHLKVRSTQDAALGPRGAEHETTAQKDAEIDLAEGHVLTLDYLHALPTNDALDTFQQYPGVGVKTAACVSLFCMQRPCFAVDTHVFRLCQWLGWVPPENKRGPKQKKVDRDTTFSHCEVRVPDHLKYGLHQLFLEHGKHCRRCKGNTGEKSEGWEDAKCVIEHLVTRTGARKGGIDIGKKGAKENRGDEDSGGQSDNQMVDAENEKEAYTPVKATQLPKSGDDGIAENKKRVKSAEKNTAKSTGVETVQGRSTKAGKERTTKTTSAKPTKGGRSANTVHTSNENEDMPDPENNEGRGMEDKE